MQASKPTADAVDLRGGWLRSSCRWDDATTFPKQKPLRNLNPVHLFKRLIFSLFFPNAGRQTQDGCHGVREEGTTGADAGAAASYAARRFALITQHKNQTTRGPSSPCKSGRKPYGMQADKVTADTAESARRVAKQQMQEQQR